MNLPRSFLPPPWVVDPQKRFTPHNRALSPLGRCSNDPSPQNYQIWIKTCTTTCGKPLMHYEQDLLYWAAQQWALLAALLPWQPRTKGASTSTPSPDRPPWVVPVSVFLSVFSRPWASRQLPGPSPAAACACCELLRTCHATCPQTALAPLGRPLGSSPCPLPAMGSPCSCHAGRGVQPPLLSCKEKGESNGRVTCDRCRPCCRASHGPLVTCQALKT